MTWLTRAERAEATLAREGYRHHVKDWGTGLVDMVRTECGQPWDFYVKRWGPVRELCPWCTLSYQRSLNFPLWIAKFTVAFVAGCLVGLR